MKKHVFIENGFVFDLTEHEVAILTEKDIIYSTDGKLDGVYTSKPGLTDEQKKVFSGVLGIPIGDVYDNIDV